MCSGQATASPARGTAVTLGEQHGGNPLQGEGCPGWFSQAGGGAGSLSPKSCPLLPEGTGGGLQHHFKWHFLHIFLPFQAKTNLTSVSDCGSLFCSVSAQQGQAREGCFGGLLGAMKRGEKGLGYSSLALCSNGLITCLGLFLACFCPCPLSGDSCVPGPQRGQEGWERGPGWLRRWAQAGEVDWSPWHPAGRFDPVLEVLARRFLVSTRCPQLLSPPPLV